MIMFKLKSIHFKELLLSTYYVYNAVLQVGEANKNESDKNSYL